MKTTARITLEQFIEDHKLGIICRRTKANPNMESETPMDHWKCVLNNPAGKTLHVFFSMGQGHKGKQPKLDEVLNCLASDCSGVENDFEDFCSELGYDTDSRKAERIFKTCKAQAVKLEEFLGTEAFQQLIWHTEQL